jgi:hypothetical protein
MEWSFLHPGRSTSGKESWVPVEVGGLVSPRAGLDTWWREESVPTTNRASSLGPKPGHCSDWGTQIHTKSVKILCNQTCRLPMKAFIVENKSWNYRNSLPSFMVVISDTLKTKTELVALVRKRTTLTELRRISAKLVPTYTDRGCCVVSATDPHGR